MGLTSCHIMPLVINSLRRGHMHTHTQTCTPTICKPGMRQPVAGAPGLKMNLRKEVGIIIKTKENSSQLEPDRNSCITNYNAPACNRQLKHMQPNVCTNKAFSSTSTIFPCYMLCLVLSLIYILYQPKQGLKLCRCARVCFICTCCWLHQTANSYRPMHYSYIATSTWFELTTCFHTFYYSSYFLTYLLYIIKHTSI